ncbi:hypothetical protein BT96DRAFT_949436 [Gymnopus androsaceus JB14]|uniref:Uncharacterized protein n=1 Tax=Gymnopus androsaceus JB14 TaxID=1447944 RepID=A0A6A4GLA3_9AGAR|nr:hypothetical protein BT96DRAFT_949436 [Gymnopus androsaceus JB14]
MVVRLAVCEGSGSGDLCGVNAGSVESEEEAWVPGRGYGELLTLSGGAEGARLPEVWILFQGEGKGTWKGARMPLNGMGPGGADAGALPVPLEVEQREQPLLAERLVYHVVQP